MHNAQCSQMEQGKNNILGDQAAYGPNVLPQVLGLCVTVSKSGTEWINFYSI